MSEQIVLQKKLSEYFTDARVRNPAFTLRAFSRRLGMNHGALSEILSGKRRASGKLAHRILSRMGAAPWEVESVVRLFNTKGQSAQEPDAIPTNQVQLDMEHYRLVSEWHHFAILSLAETQDFHSTPEWISTRLNITPVRAAQALDRLEKLELLKRNDAGKLVPTGKTYRSPDHVRDPALRLAQVANLDLARESLEHDDISERDFTAMTLAFSPEEMPLAKKLIREFQDRFEVLVDSKRKTEVFKLCVQFFPLTRGGQVKVKS